MKWEDLKEGQKQHVDAKVMLPSSH